MTLGNQTIGQVNLSPVPASAPRAAKQQAIEGTWHGGRVPFGYRAVSGALVIDSVTGPMVAEAAQRVLAGESLYRIRTDSGAASSPPTDAHGRTGHPN